MLKMRQVPMDVNAMPGLVEDMSDAEELDAESGINALKGGDVCYFCKKPGHQKRDCRKFDEWKRKNPNRKYGGDTHKANSRPSILCYNCRKEGHISQECREERRNQGWRENGGCGGGHMVDMAKSLAAVQEVLKTLVPEVVFPRELQ